jgi:hypothetical protein
MLYHHSIDLENVLYGEIKPNPEHSDFYLKDAYSWLEKEVGFYPLFLAAGENKEDIRMTGYQNQWAKIIGSQIVGTKNNGTYIQRNMLRKKGEFPNYVLFSFENIEGVFTDYSNWHIVLNSSHKQYQITDYEKRLIFKPSWNKSDWLRKAKKSPHSVQLVAPSLYLPDADRIWVRNPQTKAVLEAKGFENVQVKRIKI